LTVTRDNTDPKTGITHDTIRPSETTVVSDYVAKMQSFLGVERLSIEEAIARGGRWEIK
jgi:hypothetical protein